MSGWVAMHRSEEADALQERHPAAFLLLAQIARRVRWSDCPITGLKAGQAFVGDFKRAGIATEKAYRCAKTVLENARFAAFRGASKGTVATLLPQGVFSVSGEAKGEQQGGQGADRGRAKGGQGATNVQRNTEDKETRETIQPTSSALLPNLVSDDQSFLDKLWSLTPPKGRERSSKKLLAASLKKLPKHASPDSVLAALGAWKSSEGWTKENGQYVPGIHKWVNEGKWECPPEPSGHGAAARIPDEKLNARRHSNPFNESCDLGEIDPAEWAAALAEVEADEARRKTEAANR